MSDAPPSRRLRVLVLAPYFEPGYKAGGALRSISTLVRQASTRMDIGVVARGRDLGEADYYPDASLDAWVADGRIRLLHLGSSRIRAMLHIFKAMRQHYDILYINSLWDWLFGLFPGLLTLAGSRATVCLVAPLGQLSRGAMKFGWRKKRLALLLWKQVAKRPNVWFHASTELELRDIRRDLGSRARCITSPDPVDLPTTEVHPHATTGETPNLVFVSRISPKKNLLGVLRALAESQHSFKLRVVGPVDDVDYYEECRAYARSLELRVQVEFVGPVPPGQVQSEFAASDLFTFPTYGENFGHVIAESLHAACPILCGPDTPWSEHIMSGGGAIVDPDDYAAMAVFLDELAMESAPDRLRRSELAQAAYNAWETGLSDDHVFECVWSASLGRSDG
jgi:glycosyltransferase involved in cell wall biosynthesis